MEIKLAHNDKCKISHTKLVKIKQYPSCASLELFSKKILGMLGFHQRPIYIAWISPTNSIILELWKIHSCLFKIKRNRKLFENWRKFIQVHAKMRMAVDLLKLGFLVT